MNKLFNEIEFYMTFKNVIIKPNSVPEIATDIKCKEFFCEHLYSTIVVK